MITIDDGKIDTLRLTMLISGINLYLKSGLKLTRIATPSNMRAWATHYTGVTYKRSRAGLELAVSDLENLRSKIQG